MTITISKSESATLRAILAVVALFIVLALAGTSDYDDQVILHMSEDEYEQISNNLRHTLGHEPSDHEIVRAYKNR